MNAQAQTGDPRDAIDSQEPGRVPATLTTSSAIAVLRAEIDGQIATARQYPRVISAAIKNITGLATLDEETAAECLYALVRRQNNNRRQAAGNDDSGSNKAIEGPSIRLAEIAAQCWGNCRIEARVIEVNRQEKYVEAVGIFHDLETNMASTSNVRRRISTREGRVFSDDMIVVTGNAACAIAKRNAILAGIPRGVYRGAYQKAREIVAGTAETLVKNRDRAIKSFAAFGVTPQQIFEVLGVEGDADIGLDEIATLRALFMSLKSGEVTVEEAFAKPEKSGDPNANPLVKSSGGQQQAGGNDEVASETDKDRQHQAGAAGSAENRSGADQPSGKADANSATESGAAQDAKAPAAEASASPAQADAGASQTGAAGGSPQDQPDLLAGASGAGGSGGKPTGQAEGAGESRGNGGTSAPTPTPAERLASYSKHLLSIENGGPPKLGKASDAWQNKHGKFEGDAEKKRGLIYAAHCDRLAGQLDIEKCKAKVVEIVGQ
jgi:hypothetical protein